MNELKQPIIRAIVRCRIAEKFAELRKDTSEQWYQMGKRHGLADVALAIDLKLPTIV